MIAARALVRHFKKVSQARRWSSASAARLAIRDMGVCFSLTGSNENTDSRGPSTSYPEQSG